MTEKQRRFVEEYMVDMVGAAAARRAGYSAKMADRIAHQLLKRKDVLEAIARARKAQRERTEITADYVLTNLQRIAERCMRDETWDAAQANRSLELLGKHLKMWTDKTENKTEGTMNMRFVWDDGDDDKDTV